MARHETPNEDIGNEQPSIDPNTTNVNPNAPEPPQRYRDNERNRTAPYGQFTANRKTSDGMSARESGNTFSNEEAQQHSSIRNLVSAAIIMALVSLLIGGVILSAVAVVTAIVSVLRASEFYKNAHSSVAVEIEAESLRKSAFVAVAVSVMALIANVAALVWFYPMFLQAMQSGDYSTLLGTGQLGSSGSGSSGSIWG